MKTKKETSSPMFHNLMKAIIIALALVSLMMHSCTASKDNGNLQWPPVAAEQRPWTYWWWPGSAVDQPNITALLEDYSSAGMGGVHIIPIYGAKGYEDRYIPYLSPEWTAMLSHTAKEAERLGMGVDMTTGTGWPFGGPQVTPDDASSLVKIETFPATGGRRFERVMEEGEVQAVMAFSPGGEYIDISDGYDADARRLTWVVPPGEWNVYTVTMAGTGQQVKRAAPGGEGNVMDYLSRDALTRYLDRFDDAFVSVPDSTVRAFYNDSYEVYRANWTDDFLDAFKEMRGYDLTRYLPALLGEGDGDTVARVRHDYNETVSDLLLGCFTEPWVEWCHGHGGKTRNQAHGSPGNLLDLYAAADIPETEAFGPSGFPIPGLRRDRNIPEHFGKPDILVQKFASSAAHVAGKPLVSSESCTWLGEHFQVALSQVKPEIDALLVSGINHVFFHGMAYSPKDALWPGWLFYASTNFAPTGSFWRDIPSLNAYIARCQSFLQRGAPDNDVLLYWPVHDIWRGEADEDMLHHFQVHNAGEWLHGSPFHRAASIMWDRGYAFDYISDHQLVAAAVDAGAITVEGGSYRTLVVPGCRFMPSATLEAIAGLARTGASVVFIGGLPEDVPGLTGLPAERAHFRELLDLLGSPDTGENGVGTVSVGDGRILVSDTLENALALCGVSREDMTDSGIGFIRRKLDSGHVYFMTNLGDRHAENWFTLSVNAKSAAIFDPVSGKVGTVPVRRKTGGGANVFLSLEPGRSLILRTFSGQRVRGDKWRYLSDDGDPVDLTGTWNVTFIEGDPALPNPASTDRLASWTEFGGEDVLSFHGTASYTLSFGRPAAHADDWMLDLGTVCESARVRLNGEDIGTVWCLPFRIPVGHALRRGENRLEIEVTNLAANRIADLDRRGVPWKIFHDINYVTIRYEPFDASGWPPMESGLLGPVRLVPMELKDP